MIIPNKKYIGIIWNGIDLEKKLKYPVYIRELSPEGNMNIFWMKNECYSNNFIRWFHPEYTADDPKGKRSAGSYFPLQYGMVVEVVFRSQHQQSGYISKIINNNGYIPTDHNIKDDFYLVCKTMNDSYIYIDDKRNLMHLMNNNGSTNLLLEKNKIILHAGELLNDGADGVTTDSIVEVGNKNILLKLNNNFISIDESGITLSVGDKSRTFLKLTESGIDFGSAGNVKLKSEGDLNISGNHTYIQGDTELDIFSNNTRLTGSQLLNMNGNVVSVDSLTETAIKGNHISIDALLKLKTTSLMVDIQAYSQLYMSSLIQVNDSQIISNTAATISNAGSVIFNDGTIMNNMGIGTSMGTSMKASAMATSIGTEMAAASLGTIFTSTNDPIMGLAATMMTTTIPGSAQPVNGMNQMPIIIPSTTLGCSLAVSYINGYNTAGNNNIFSPLPLPITI